MLIRTPSRRLNPGWNNNFFSIVSFQKLISPCKLWTVNDVSGKDPLERPQWSLQGSEGSWLKKKSFWFKKKNFWFFKNVVKRNSKEKLYYVPGSFQGIFHLDRHLRLQSVRSRYKSGNKKTGRRAGHRAYERVFSFLSVTHLS